MRYGHTRATPEVQDTRGVRQASYHFLEPAIAHDGFAVTLQIGPSDHIIAVGYDQFGIAWHNHAPVDLSHQFAAPIDARSVPSTSGVTSASERKIACPRATFTNVNGTPLRLIASLTNSGSLEAASKPARSAASASEGVPRGAKPA